MIINLIIFWYYWLVLCSWHFRSFHCNYNFFQDCCSILIQQT